MKTFLALAVILGIFTLGQTYSKYGRTCKDIGCPGSQVCVMQTDPCSYRQRSNECGSYPTCKRASGSKPSCATYICPPTKVCKLDGDTPKCVDDHSKRGQAGYDTQSGAAQPAQGAAQPAQGVAQPAHGGSSGGSLYPSVPKNDQGGNINNNNRQQPPYNGGYPGYQQPGYQQPGHQQPGQYPGAYPGYQQPPQGQYPGGGYQQYPGGYQGGYPGYQQPYPQGGYPNYPQYNNNQRYPQQPTGQKSGTSFLSDTLSDSLKTIGTDLLKNAFNKLIQNNLSGGKTNANPSH